APVVAGQHRGLGAAFVDETADVVSQFAGVILGGAVRLRRQVVASRVGRDAAEPRRRERLDLAPPAVPELGEAVQQDDQRSVTCLDVMQPLVADLGVAFPHAADPVSLPVLFRHLVASSGIIPKKILRRSTAAPLQGEPWWFPWSEPGPRRCYSASSSRRLDLASSTSSPPPPDRIVLVAYRVKPLSWP